MLMCLLSLILARQENHVYKRVRIDLRASKNVARNETHFGLAHNSVEDLVLCGAITNVVTLTLFSQGART